MKFASPSAQSGFKTEVVACESQKEAELKHKTQITNYKVKLEMLEKKKRTQSYIRRQSPKRLVD